MRFSPGLLDEIRTRLPVSAVVGRRVQLKKQGREWAGLSPFNAEKTPSFFVNDQKGFYHCFSSGKHGDIFSFLMETEGLSFPEAIERLAQDAGVEVPRDTPEDVAREKQRATLHDVMELAAAFFEKSLQGREGAAARGYLADRGLTAAIQGEFRLGYSPNERFALRDHLAGKGVDRDSMIEAGLLVHGDDIPVPYDRFRNRVMFPIGDARGRIIAFGGRALERDVPAKYLNSPETPLFHKGANLYNHHRARAAAHEKGTAIVVEGYVDAIMMSVGGFPHTVAPLGTALTEEQLGLIWRMAEEPILCFDGDKAGRKAAYRAIDLAMPQLGAGKTLRFALLPDGKDPDDLVRSGGSRAVDDVLRSAMPLADLLFARETEGQDISTPEKRAAIERRLNEAIKPLADETLRKHYRNDIQARLEALFGRPQRSPYTKGQNPRRGQSQPLQQASSLARESAIVRGSRTVLSSREALVLAAAIRHPALLERHCEAIAGIDFDNPEAEKLRGALVDAAALGIHDGPALRSHLEQSGFSRMVERLDAATSSLHWWLSTDTATPDIERAFEHVVGLHRKMRTLHRELQAAAAALERDMTDEHFAHLLDIKAQIASLEGAEATIEGFGALSGHEVPGS